MIETMIEDDRWASALPDADKLAAQCFEAAARTEPAIKGDAALLLTSDAAMQALNEKFRGKKAPTNVLSFPSGGDDAFLGDMALAYETCVGEADEKKIALRDHAAHLIVHGLLHLIGFDHQTDSEASAMECREAEILNGLGICNPYTDVMETTT